MTQAACGFASVATEAGPLTPAAASLHRIVSALAQRVAATDAPQALEHADQGAAFLDGRFHYTADQHRLERESPDWIIGRDLFRGQPGFSERVHKIIGVVEAVSLVNWMGWDWAPVLLRPIVRLQAGGTHRTTEYDRCCQEVAQKQLLRLARRRPPGNQSLGEEDPAGFFERALLWAESNPEARMELVAEALVGGVTLEDAIA